MEHEILMDLLPLYHDGVCSDASRAAVEEHLQSCEICREALKARDAPLPAAEEQKNAADGAAMKRISDEWKKNKWKARLKGAAVAAAVCVVLSAGSWVLNTWTVLPVGNSECSVEVYQLKNGDIGVHWVLSQASWYALTFSEEADGTHWYLERPLLRTTVFNFDNKSYHRSGDALFSVEDALGADSLYFGLGADSILLWEVGKNVNLPAASEAQEAQWG